MTNEKCDFCGGQAVYDGKTLFGPWGYMRENHFRIHGVNKKGLFTRLGVTASDSKVKKGAKNE